MYEVKEELSSSLTRTSGVKEVINRIENVEVVQLELENLCDEMRKESVKGITKFVIRYLNCQKRSIDPVMCLALRQEHTEL